MLFVITVVRRYEATALFSVNKKKGVVGKMSSVWRYLRNPCVKRACVCVGAPDAVCLSHNEVRVMNGYARRDPSVYVMLTFSGRQ